MNTVYLNDWTNDSYQAPGLPALIRDFELDRLEPSPLEGAEILLASYSYKNYSGSAFVLFERDGQLYEVNGGHCSCYGLEGQWDPELTTVAALNHRLLTDSDFGMDGWGDHNEFRTELVLLLNKLSEEREEL